jgi:hypothetical protein
MTSFTWVGGSSSNWADPANWTPTGFPSATGDTATIDAAGTYTVSIASGETDTIDSLTLNAAGATLSVGGTLAFGGANTASLEAGTLVIGSGGAITGAPDMTIAAGATFDISGAANQTIGSLSGAGLVVVGTHNLTIGGDNLDTTFSGTVQGGASPDQGALVHVGTGTLTLDNATMTNNELIIGTGNLAVGEGTSQIFYLALGEGTGNSGSATITGGVLNIGGTSPTLKSALLVGDFGGTGLVTQTGGTVNVTGSFNIGNQGGNGTYDLESGTLNLIGGGLYNVGRNANGNPAGSGTINVSGGVFDIQGGSLILGNFYPNTGTNGQGSGLMVQTGGTVMIAGGSAIYMASLGNGEYDLDGGTLEVGATSLANHYQGGGGTGTFHMGGGTLAVTGSDLTTDVQAVLDTGTESTLSLGALNASFSGSVTGAGTLDVSGTGTVSFAALDATGTLELQGGTVDITNSGSIGEINVDAGASATLTVTTGKTLSAGAIAIDTGATLTVNGSVTGNPDVTVATGATLDVSNSPGEILGSLSGGGLVLVGSQLLVIGVDGKDTTFSGTLQGAALDTGQVEQIGTGTLTLDNATMNAGELLVGAGNLAVCHGTNQLFYLAIGEGTGNSGSATISGGILNIGSTGTNLGTSSALQVGDFGGTGLVTQTGGTVNIIGSFNIGNQGGTGTYDLEGGTVNLEVGLYNIGRNSGGNAAGSGTVNVSGGLLDIQSSNFVLGNLQTNTGTHGQASGLLTQTGGIVLVESGSAIFLSSKGDGEYNLDGGTLKVGGTGLRSSYNGGGGSGALHMGGGTLAVTGSSLSTDAAIVLDSGTESVLSLGALNASFSGTLTGAGTLDLSGTGTAGFASLGGTGTVSIGTGSTLSVTGAVGSGETIAFTGTGGTLSLAAPGSFAGAITGFTGGDRIDLTSLAFVDGGTASLDAVTGILTVTEGAGTFTRHLIGDFTGQFFHLADDGHGGTMITEDDVPCYCRGTRILTADGEVPVENLRIGHYIVTAEGESLPLKWIGRRSYRDWLAVGNADVQPICFRAGSIADGVPARDLNVSPEHAMYLDGMLVPAHHLVNGVSIVKIEGLEEIEYFHLEFDRHVVVFAEGAAAESFVDDDSRMLFHNAEEYRRLYPDEPRSVEAEFCAPRVEDGPALAVLHRRLAARAAHLRPGGAAAPWGRRGRIEVITRSLVSGWVYAGADAGPQALAVLLNGAIVGRVVADRYRADLEAAGVGDGRHGFSFVLPRGLPTGDHRIEVRREIDWTKV